MSRFNNLGQKYKTWNLLSQNRGLFFGIQKQVHTYFTQDRSTITAFRRRKYQVDPNKLQLPCNYWLKENSWVLICHPKSCIMFRVLGAGKRFHKRWRSRSIMNLITLEEKDKIKRLIIGGSRNVELTYKTTIITE